MRITRQTQLFKYTDKVVGVYMLQIVRSFNRIKRRLAVMTFDEITIADAVNVEWAKMEVLMRESLWIIAVYYYHLGCDACDKDYEDELFMLYFLAYLNDYDELTHYQYINELDRKRARLIEALLSVNTLAKRIEQLKAALKILTKQYKQMADNITEKAILKAYEEAGVTHVEWVTQGDERVCPVCGALDHRIFTIKKCPALPQHYNCRCFIIPAD